MGGTENQRTGRRAEAYVRNTLEDAGITAGPLDPDHGEDLLVEVDGASRAATGEPALTALIQVKGHAHKGPDLTAVERKIKRKHLLRWSAQQLPVFLVAVYLKDQDKRVYVESIDRFLAEGLGAPDISRVTQDEFSIPLKRAHDLSSFLVDEIKEFYRKVGPHFENLSPSELQDIHLEVVERRPGQLAKDVSMFHWKIIWKSPRRPVFFAATLRELVRQSRAEYSAEAKPTFVCFHIYRSLAAVDANTAVARVDFIDPEHSLAHAFLAQTGMVPLRVRSGSESESIREFVASKTATPHGFANIVRALAPKIDAITEILLQARSATDAERAWTAELLEQYKQVDREYEQGPLPPLEFRPLDDHLRGYLIALWGHYRFAVEIRDIPWIRTERRIREYREELQGFYKSWRHFLQALRW